MSEQERREGIAQLRRVLDAMIYLLQDNPEIPLPWTVDMSVEADPETFTAIVAKHQLGVYAGGTQTNLGPIIAGLLAASDRDAFYLPWSLTKKDCPGE